MVRPRTVLLAVLALIGALLTGALPGTGSRATAAPATFTHPGVLVSKSQLDFVRTKVNAGEQPWKAAWDQMIGSSYASLSRVPKPRAIVECGSYSNPNYGCTDERQDAIAAYSDALAWYITRDVRYAQKAIELMDAWSATIQDHTNSNAPLQSGWAGSVWPRAAELIKYTYTGTWANAGRFATMLRTVYLPEVINGKPNNNGNWELIMMEAALGISIHLEDRTSYDKAMGIFLGRVPAYVYHTTDGSQPKYPPRSSIDTTSELVGYWHDQTTYVNGLAQETCRDFGHTGYGISSIGHVAETTRIQGQDLWPQLAERMRHAYGFHTKYENGEAVPSWLCGGSVTKGLGPITEVGFNALHNRLGIGMSNTEQYTLAKRPQGTENHYIAWETLTHANNPG